MNVFFTMLQKEINGIWRSKKFIYIPIVFMLYMVMQPITNYFMEDILKMGGGLPEGTVFDIPVPSSEVVLASVLSQLNTLGILLIIVSVMGAISDERKNGSLTFLLVRPVSSISLISSKTVANSFLMVTSFICGYFLSYYYTTVLFGSVPLLLVIESMLLYCVFIIFIVTCVVFSSALLNSNGAIAISNVIFLGVLSISSGWFTEALQWSPTRLSNYAILIVTGEKNLDGLLGCLTITILLILLFHFAAAAVLKKKML